MRNGLFWRNLNGPFTFLKFILCWTVILKPAEWNRRLRSKNEVKQTCFGELEYGHLSRPESATEMWIFLFSILSYVSDIWGKVIPNQVNVGWMNNTTVWSQSCVICHMRWTQVLFEDTCKKFYAINLHRREINQNVFAGKPTHVTILSSISCTVNLKTLSNSKF